MEKIKQFLHDFWNRDVGIPIQLGRHINIVGSVSAPALAGFVAFLVILFIL